jgi:hypothetical protein
MFFSIKKVLAGRKNYFLIAWALAFAIFLKKQSVKLSWGQAYTDVLIFISWSTGTNAVAQLGYQSIKLYSDHMLICI